MAGRWLLRVALIGMALVVLAAVYAIVMLYMVNMK